jgi:hypothetical protein
MLSTAGMKKNTQPEAMAAGKEVTAAEYASIKLHEALLREERLQSELEDWRRRALMNARRADELRGQLEDYVRQLTGMIEQRNLLLESCKALLAIANDPLGNPYSPMQPEIECARAAIARAEPKPARRPHEARGSDASNACFGA